MRESSHASSGSEGEERVGGVHGTSDLESRRGGLLSGSEIERRRVPIPLATPRSSKEKRKAPRKDVRRSRLKCAVGLRELMGLLAVIGPLGTLISMGVLPQSMDGLPVGMRRVSLRGEGERARVIHLSLAGSERKARFVLSSDVHWENFLAGVQERLSLGSISRIETSAGEAIMSVEDLMHDDNLIIYSDAALSRGRLLFGKDGLPAPVGPARGRLSSAPSLPLPLSRLVRRRRTGSLPGEVADETADASEVLPNLFGGVHDRRRVRQLAHNLSSTRTSGALSADGGSADGDGELVDDDIGGFAAGEADDGAESMVASVHAEGEPLSSDMMKVDPAPEEATNTEADRRAAEALAQAQKAKQQMLELEEQAATARAAAEAAHENELEQARERQRNLQKLFLEEQHEPLKLSPKSEGYRRGYTPCGERHPDFRIGMIIPWVGQIPIWSHYFLSSARGSASIADFLVFHEGQSRNMPTDLPSNVRVFDLGQGGLSQLLGMGLGEALELPVRNASIVVKAMRFMFEKWPRLVAEYKPAFGSIFSNYLKHYTHWGYCDLDMLIGNLPMFIERSELSDFDIVTYTFGDQEAVYLRGQWTLHRNAIAVSTVWKGCPHLGSQLQKELLLKVAWVRRMESRGIQNYPKRFQSAEGCYSQKAVAAQSLKIKTSNKQFVGLTVPSDNAIYYVDGSVWQCGRDVAVDVAQLAKLASKHSCQVELPGIVSYSTPPYELQVSSEGCGRWMPVEYRMCAAEILQAGQEVATSTNTFFNGSFWGQRVSFAPELVLSNGCRQGAFFHFQEWKKAWSGQVGYAGNNVGVEPVGDSPRYSARARNFKVSPDGISLLRTDGDEASQAEHSY